MENSIFARVGLQSQKTNTFTDKNDSIKCKIDLDGL